MPSVVEVKEKGMCAVWYNVYTSRNTWRLIAILHFSSDKRYIPSKYSSVKFQFDSGKKLSFVGRNSKISESQRHFTLTQSFGVSTTKRIHAIEKGIYERDTGRHK